MKKKRWAVFISGTGSNLQALLDTRETVDVVLVISSTATAYGCIRAQREGVPTYVMKDKSDWTGVQRELEARQVTQIFLAGFMRIVPPAFVRQWQDRIVNIHPSLLPSFPGTQSIKKAFEAQAPLGATAHLVVEEVDAGAPVLTRRCPTLGSLEDSEFFVHLTEHRLVREVMNKWNVAQM